MVECSQSNFIGYSDNDVVRPSCIMLPLMIDCAKHVKNNKTMSFKISDSKLLKRYTQMWKRVRNLLNIKLDSPSVYDNDKYIKTKIKI